MTDSRNTTAIDPRLALVLLWHWTKTPSPQVPAWCLAHPLWPQRHAYRTKHLVHAALPLIEAMEREILA